jgi:hypothetical protein
MVSDCRCLIQLGCFQTKQQQMGEINMSTKNLDRTNNHSASAGGLRILGKGLAAFLTFALLATGAAFAQPANDNFANAFVISGTSVRATGTNVDATREPGEPTSVQDGAGREPTGNRSVWWRWVAPASGQVTVATGRLTPASERSTFDTQLGVYTGNAVNALTEVASNEDAEPNNRLGAGLSELTFNAVAGTTYHIMVNGWQSQTGNIVLHLGDSGVPPVGHTVTVSANPAAGGTVTGGGTFQTGQSATVTAAPNAGFQFLNWSEGGTAVSTNLSFTFNVAANRTLVANFAGDATGTNITVTVSASPAAGGTVTGGGTVAPGTQVTLTATPNQGFTFVEWREGTTVVGTDAQLTFQANAHRNLVAVFSGTTPTGDTSLLWQHTSGALALWTVANGQLVEGVALQGLPQPGPEWAVVGTADFDNDGHVDILWQHVGTGRLAVWYMSGVALREAVLLTGLPLTGPGWHVVGLNDFDGDGNLDLLWQHVDGWLALWRMQGLNLVEASVLMGLPLAGREWRVVAVEDLNGDGQADLLWQHTSGALAIWTMQGLQLQQARVVEGAPLPGAQWGVVGSRMVGGQSELLWMHSTGALATWRLQGPAFQNAAVLTDLPLVPAGWRVVQAGN